MELQEHYLLAEHTSFKVGGSARFFIEVHTEEELVSAFAYAKERSVPAILIGGGSNTLVDDGEAEALFIRPVFLGNEVTEATYVVSAGEVWDKVVAHAVDAGFYGLENLSGIPGSVGGAVVQNIGAYGASLSERVAWVDVYDEVRMQTRRLENKECAFGYRDSLFKQEAGKLVVMRVALGLQREKKLTLSYRDIATYFADTEASLESVRNAVLSIRANKFPDLSREGTAGSFFKNPIVSLEEGERLQEKYSTMPLFPLPEASGYKVPLAWIMDQVLHMRGFSIGPVRCYEKQPLVLVATRGASAHDVRTLAHEVQTRVFAETNIHIEPEVCVMRGSDVSHTINF